MIDCCCSLLGKMLLHTELFHVHIRLYWRCVCHACMCMSFFRSVLLLRVVVYSFQLLFRWQNWVEYLWWLTNMHQTWIYTKPSHTHIHIDKLLDIHMHAGVYMQEDIASVIMIFLFGYFKCTWEQKRWTELSTQRVSDKCQNVCIKCNVVFVRLHRSERARRKSVCGTQIMRMFFLAICVSWCIWSCSTNEQVASASEPNNNRHTSDTCKCQKTFRRRLTKNWIVQKKSTKTPKKKKETWAKNGIGDWCVHNTQHWLYYRGIYTGIILCNAWWTLFLLPLSPLLSHILLNAAANVWCALTNE